MRSREERLAALLESVERMAGGETEYRAEISDAHDEVDALAFAINVMVGELSYARDEADLRNAELAAAQESLMRKERLAALGQLSGGVAHQIRNPLAAILNATYVIKRHLPPETHPHVNDAIGIVHDEIRHANHIITGLLDYARVRQPDRRPTSLLALIDRVLGSDWIPTTVCVERAPLVDLPPLDIDADQLLDVMHNVVRNAVEAMPDGGTLGVQLLAEADWAVVVVTDTGPGILPELAGRLFEPLHSTKPMGVGLGLVTARTFVEGHGGRITAVPGAGGGRFEIRLPVGRTKRASRP